MRIAWTILAYLAALAVTLPVVAFGVLFLAGPHAGLLPAPLDSAVLISGGLAVLALPVLAARWAWMRSATRDAASPDRR